MISDLTLPNGYSSIAADLQINEDPCMLASVMVVQRAPCTGSIYIHPNLSIHVI
jgi:hypothetical protein